MSLGILCIVVGAFYVVLWFFDSLFKSCLHYPYYAFIEGTGLRIGIFNFTWTTAAFNRCIYRWSNNSSKILRKWFTCGYFVTVWFFLPFAIWLLFTFVFQHFKSVGVLDGLEVKAVLPGVNIPVSDFWVYFIAIALSSILHELGHAMAAAQDNVQLISVGFFVFTIIPLAFVQMNTDHLNSLEIGKRLRIYCAGVWHNLAVACIALLLLFTTPILFSLAYQSNIGVKIVEMADDSPLRDARGLDKGDIIVSINGCPVKNSKDWTDCLHKAYERFGLCTTAEFVAQNDETIKETITENDVVECCRKDDIYGFCFQEEPKLGVDSMLPGQFSCLKPRDMIKNQLEICTKADGYKCSEGKHCLKPSLNQNTYFIIVERQDNNAVVYLGLPYDLHKTISVDQYFPYSNLFSFFSPTSFEKLLKYIYIFSLGIAFLNVIPCYGTDGHHIARNIIQIIAGYLHKKDNFVSIATIITVFLGTAITGPTLVYLFYKAITDTSV